jgi:amino acid adenylation domain-containing protein
MILEYASDRFDSTSSDSSGTRFGHALGAARCDSRARVSLPLLLDDDAARLEAWNRTETPFPRDATLASLFAEVAAERGAAAALEFTDATLTYAELDARANRLARRLRALGAGPETRVGVCLERSAALVVAIVAALKTGAAYVPLDPSYPGERLAWMASDAGLGVVVSDWACTANLEGAGVPTLLLDGDAAAIEAEDAAPLAGVPVLADGVACVVYTSGSTGTPKGIGIVHRGVVRLVREADYAQLGASDRVGQTSNASFDAFTWELWAALLNGSTLVGVPREVALSPVAVARFVRERRLTTLFLTTALFNQVAREVPDAYAPLDLALFGGEAADPEPIRAVLAAGPPKRLLHMYGPSESTTYASWHRVRQVPADATSVPIGMPVANTTLYVLDGAMRPVPAGAAGELFTGGDGLARGYLGRPGLTADRFIPDPFSARPGARLYRTGDRVRRGADGAIEFLGRVDRQVKVRGFRIEPGEVEAVLLHHPQVRAAVVEPVETGPERELAAYVVAEGAAPAVADLRAFLGDRLPPHMVPAAFVYMKALPLTPNGKVDRRGLPVPVIDRADAGAVYAAPCTPVEERLAGIWAEVLGMDAPGIDDDFFALGGHSLRATRVATRLRDAFGVELTVREVFEAPTIRALAVLVDERMAPSNDDLLAELALLDSLSDDEVMRLLGEA